MFWGQLCCPLHVAQAKFIPALPLLWTSNLGLWNHRTSVEILPRHHGRGDGVGGGLGGPPSPWCWSLCTHPTRRAWCLNFLKHLVLGYPIPAGLGAVWLYVPAHGVRREMFQEKIPVRDWAAVPHASKSGGFLYPTGISHRTWVCHRETPGSLFCCWEGQLWLHGVRCTVAFQQRAPHSGCEFKYKCALDSCFTKLFPLHSVNNCLATPEF